MDKLFSPKTRAVATPAGTALAFVIIVSWAAHDFGGITIPPEVASALGVLVSALMGRIFAES